MKKSLTILVLLALSACGQSQSSLKNIGNSYAIAEFEPNQAIVVSIDSLARLGAFWVQTLVDAGAPAVVVLDSNSPYTLPLVSSFREKMPAILSDQNLSKKVKFLTVGNEQENLWTRDYIPFTAYVNGVLNFIDFRYFQNGDNNSNEFISKLKQNSLTSNSYFEGGNFATDGHGLCFIGRGGSSSEKNAVHENISNELLRLNVCREVELMPSFKSDLILIATDHIDMWMKIIGPREALVSEIDTDLLADFYNRKSIYEKALGNKFEIFELRLKEIQALLDEGVNILTKRGFRVTRIPVALPGGLLQAPVNGVQIDKTLVLPQQMPTKKNLGNLAPELFSNLNIKTQARLAALGFKSIFIDASEIEKFGGSMHCATAHIPVASIHHLQ
jgi:N-dimethylarginine dimethylaminohydrolase